MSQFCNTYGKPLNSVEMKIKSINICSNEWLDARTDGWAHGRMDERKKEWRAKKERKKSTSVALSCCIDWIFSIAFI